MTDALRKMSNSSSAMVPNKYLSNEKIKVLVYYAGAFAFQYGVEFEDERIRDICQ